MKIEKNIPAPKSRSKYPFREMEVGNSFWSDNANIRSIATRAGKRLGYAFSTRAELNGDVKGFRVWRTA